jgi:hypothetical protein
MGRIPATNLLGCERAVPNVDHLLEEDLMFGNHTCFISPVGAADVEEEEEEKVRVTGVDEVRSGTINGENKSAIPVVTGGHTVFTMLRSVTKRWFAQRKACSLLSCEAIMSSDVSEKK